MFLFFSKRELANFRHDGGGIGQVWPLSSALKEFFRWTLFNFTTLRIHIMGSVTVVGWLESSEVTFINMLTYFIIWNYIASF